MKFISVPEIANKNSVYSIFSLFRSSKENGIDVLRNIPNRFKDYQMCDYYTDVQMIKFEKFGDVLIFCFREDGAKCVFINENRTNTGIVIWDKEIFDFIAKQILKNINSKKENELIIPRMDSVQIQEIENHLFDSLKSSLPFQYCYQRYYI